MKSYQRIARRGRRLAITVVRVARHQRRGTVIIVVLALLGMLAFLGFFAVAFTGSEKQSATYFAAAANVNATSATDPDAFFNYILRQIIIGPSTSEKQSALYGGNKSLLPTMFGRDLSPFNGQGINVIWNGATAVPANQPAVDQNYNGVSTDPVDNQALLQLNLSPAAQQTANIDLNNFPATGNVYPDVDVNYTYPDINSAFLSYDGLVPTGPGNPPVRVIIPSFERPQYLRSLGAPNTWYIAAATAKYVLHPHAEHVCIDGSGNVTTTQRFVTGTHMDTTANPLYPYSIAGDAAQPTLTPPYAPPMAPQEGVWSFTGPGPITAANAPTISYDADVDNDGVLDSFYMDFGFPLMSDVNGNQFVALGAVKIIDLDPLFNLNVHGNRSGQVTLGPSPIPAFGSNTAAGSPVPTMISQSDQGISPSEVNPMWALNARPLATSPDFPGTVAQLQTALQQHVLFFRSPAQSTIQPTDDHSANSFELANMEWWNALSGRPQLSASANPTTIPPTVSGSSLPGRFGENTKLLDVAVPNVLNGLAVQAGVGTVDPFPLAGLTNYPPSTANPNTADDNDNQQEGTGYVDEQNVTHTAFGHPLDFFGTGSSVVAITGQQKNTRMLTAIGSERFPQYSNFWIHQTATGSAPVQWAAFSAALGGGLFAGGGEKLQVDEGAETVTEPSAVVQQPNDAIYGPQENTIQTSSGDFNSLGNPARTASLMPFNFVSSARAAMIRQRFTSTSWDLKSFGKEFLYDPTATTPDARRLWEFTDTSPGATGAGPFRFPPNFVGTGGTLSPTLLTALPTPPFTTPDDAMPANPAVYPLRLAIANLIQVIANPKQTPVTTSNGNVVLPQRPISANGLTEVLQSGTDSNGNPTFTFRFRPLTPHPTNLPATPLVVPFPSASIQSKTLPFVPFVTEPEQLNAGSTPQQQEWLAHYDRQRLARDIYTLLYLMGGGNDTINYATTSNAAVAGVRPLYSEDQLQEMAQFAVNLVDAMDPDDHITIFEYDKDLSNGWGLDDNAYDGTADPQPGDRGVVYGIERQQLALNEAMVTLSQQCTTTTAPITPVDHPDTQWDDTKRWSFFYLEMENVGPSPVDFTNQQWQIAVKQSPIVAIPSINYGTSSNVPAQSGEMRLIFNSTMPNVAAGTNSRLTIGGMVGSNDGVNFNVPNLSPSGQPYPSYMVVNPNDKDATYGSTAYNNQFPIAPRSAFVSPTASPFGNTTALNLDLIQPGQTGLYNVVPPNPNTPTADGTPVLSTTIAAGSQLLQFQDPTQLILPSTNPVVLRIELRRRVDLHRAPPDLTNVANNATQSADNPWVVVDYMDVPVGVLALQIAGNNNDFAPQIQYQLGHLTAPAGPPYYSYVNPGGAVPAVSTERTQPLYHDVQLNPFNATSVPGLPNGPFPAATTTQYPRNGGVSTLLPPLWQGNSLGQDNDAAGFNPGTIPSSTATPIQPHPLYQPHFDRDFTSIVELFNIPLFGPYVPQYPPPTTLNNPLSTSSIGLNSGLTHLMGSRITEAGTPVSATGSFTPEMLVGADYVPIDPALTKSHYLGYGSAGYRLQHPEGIGSTTADANPLDHLTENRWFRALGLIEVPTRTHRGLEENAVGNPPYQISIAPYQIAAGSIGGSFGFYRTPGKMNINTLRYPELVAGLIDATDVVTMNFLVQTPITNLPGPAAGYSLPYQLLDTVEAANRDWWLQFITARDGIDPLPPASGGTGLPLPGLPRSAPATTTGVTPSGSRPFRGLGFSAYGGGVNGSLDASGYNGELESNVLRTLPTDPTSPPVAGTPAPDPRRRLFELGTLQQHLGTSSTLPVELDYSVKQRLLSKLIGNTTTRSNVFGVWIQVDFFQAKDVNPPNGVVRIGTKLGTNGVAGTSPAYRGFFVIDRSQALPLVNSQSLPQTNTSSPFFPTFSFNQSFNYQSLILYRQRIQ